MFWWLIQNRALQTLLGNGFKWFRGKSVVPPTESTPLSSPPWIFLRHLVSKNWWCLTLHGLRDKMSSRARGQGEQFCFSCPVSATYLLLNCKVQIKVEGSWLCLLFVRRVNETFHSSLKSCYWRDDVSDPWLKILEKERER